MSQQICAGAGASGTKSCASCPGCWAKDEEIRVLRSRVMELEIKAAGRAPNKNKAASGPNKKVERREEEVLRASFTLMKNRFERSRDRRRCLRAWRNAAKTSKVFRGLVINARAEQASRRRQLELARQIFSSLRDAQLSRREDSLHTLQPGYM